MQYFSKSSLYPACLIRAQNGKTSAQIKPHVTVTDAGHLCGSEKGSTSHIKQLMTLLWAGRCKQKITTDHWITGNVAFCLEKANINLKYSIKVVGLFQLCSSYQKKSMICSPKSAWYFLSQNSAC